MSNSTIAIAISAVSTTTTDRMYHIEGIFEGLRCRELAALRPHRYNGNDPETLADEVTNEVGFRLRPDYRLDAIEVLHGHLHRTYRSGDYVGITYAGSLVYESCGSREWDYDGIDADADIVVGCPSIGYGYRLRAGRRLESSGRIHPVLWTEADMVMVLDELDRRLPDLVRRVEEIEADAAKRRKEFGRETNELFRALGADKATKDSWWGMQWKREVAPEEFVGFCRKAEQDRNTFSLALEARSGADLEELGWKCRPSVPRTEDLLKAVAKATGIKPATEKAWRAWKTGPRRWVFGE